MTWPIVTMPIETEADVVGVRQRARLLAERLGFERQDQTRVATAVSEIARNAFSYAGGGRAELRRRAADAGREEEVLQLTLTGLQATSGRLQAPGAPGQTPPAACSLTRQPCLGSILAR